MATTTTGEDSLASSNDYFLSTTDFMVDGVNMIPSEDIPMQFATPDYFETNPQIVKAEMAFFATPHTIDYSESVYENLKDIEEVCAVDFAAMCAPTTAEPEAFGMSNNEGSLMMSFMAGKISNLYDIKDDRYIRRMIF